MRNRKGKWQPFDALTGYHEALEKVVLQKNKQARPVLASEYFEELNEKLYEALASKKEVSIKYYDDGYIYKVSGIISKVDTVYKMIIINNKKIPLNYITEIILEEKI